MTHIKNFHEDKYKRQINKTSLDCKNFLKHIKVPQLSEADNSIHNKPIKLSEIHKLLNNMKNSKSPGNNGLTKELYCLAFLVI